MAFVLDASVCAAWALADESSAIADSAAVRIRTETAFVPAVWWYEVRNILVSNERRGRIAPEDCLRFLESLEQLNIAMTARPESSAVMGIARQHKLTVYDAEYLTLAVRERLPLATLDKALQTAAEAAGVALLG